MNESGVPKALGVVRSILDSVLAAKQRRESSLPGPEALAGFEATFVECVRTSSNVAMTVFGHDAANVRHGVTDYFLTPVKPGDYVARHQVIGNIGRLDVDSELYRKGHRFMLDEVGSIVAPVDGIVQRIKPTLPTIASLVNFPPPSNVCWPNRTVICVIRPVDRISKIVVWQVETVVMQLVGQRLQQQLQEKTETARLAHELYLQARQRVCVIVEKAVFRHQGVLRRKYATLCMPDEYGIVDDTEWRGEVQRFAEKVINPEILSTGLSQDINDALSVMNDLFAVDVSEAEREARETVGKTLRVPIDFIVTNIVTDNEVAPSGDDTYAALILATGVTGSRLKPWASAWIDSEIDRVISLLRDCVSDWKNEWAAILCMDDELGFVEQHVMELCASLHVQDASQSREATTGREFEFDCAQVLLRRGWSVQVCGGPGDQGLDIIATKDCVSVGIQCKLHAGPVGNSAVHQAAHGSMYHKTHYAVVVSRSGFTDAARDAAQRTQTLLVDPPNLPRLSEIVSSAKRTHDNR